MSDLLAAARAGDKSLRVFGIVTMVLGGMAILTPMMGVSVAPVVGTLVLAAGLGRMFWALQTASLTTGVLALPIGSLTLLSGVALLANPLFGDGWLEVALATYLIADGACEIATALRLRPESGRKVLLLAGIASVLLGFAIWQQAPLAGAWATGVLLGCKLFTVGLTMAAVGPAELMLRVRAVTRRGRRRWLPLEGKRWVRARKRHARGPFLSLLATAMVATATSRSDPSPDRLQVSACRIARIGDVRSIAALGLFAFPSSIPVNPGRAGRVVGSRIEVPETMERTAVQEKRKNPTRTEDYHGALGPTRAGWSFSTAQQRVQK